MDILNVEVTLVACTLKQVLHYLSGIMTLSITQPSVNFAESKFSKPIIYT